MSRYRFGDVWDHPSRVGDWWLELPMRQRSWWSDLLWEPGGGWLRWRSDYRERISYDPPDIDQWWVYPPLQRHFLVLRGWLHHPVDVLLGRVRWCEWPTPGDVKQLISEDRKRLWA